MILQKYSVLMSVYKNDNPSFLKCSIESMLSQTIQADQIVLVIDGPISDELKKVIYGYKDKYEELFTLVPLEKNGGLGNALNAGIKVCRNELIARMDADDISKPDRCEKQLEMFSSNSTLEILGTQVEEFIDDPFNIVSRRIVPTNSDSIKKFARRRSPFNHPTVMYKKTVIERLGMYKAYGRKEDLDLFIRAVNNGCNVMNLSESYLYYRTSKENMKRRKTWNNCSEYIVIMYGFWKKKYLNIIDLFYVIVGQCMMFLLPESITEKLSNLFLRN